jgi:hypothetical protein
MTIQVILGEYLDSKVKLIILSNKNYSNVNLYKNGKIIKNITIKEYRINNFELEDINIGNYYFFELEYLDKILDTFVINLKSNPFENVLIINCDSGYGFETGTWDLIDNTSTKYAFHLGDQIYNDKIFQKNFNILKNKKIEDITKKDKQVIWKECYNYFLEQFTRNNKTNVLKNNFNIMMPDDHEVVDNSFIDRIPKEQIVYYNLIYSIIKNLSNSIELELKFNRIDISYIEDKSNSTLYIINYSLNFNEDFFNQFNYKNKIENYKNIIFLQRKQCNSIKNNVISEYIYKENQYILVDIDFVLNLGKKYKEKVFIILCGDDHIKSTGEYYLNNKKLLTIKGVGSINSTVDLFNSEIILNTKLKNITLQTKKQLENGFIKIFYKNENINIKDIINHKSYFYHVKNSIFTAGKFLSFGYQK